jgi:methionyl-tRNA formyltransferase
VRLVFAGTPAAAVPSLCTLLASDHDLVAVITRPDAPAGRGRALRPSPVKQVAVEAGVEVLTPAKPGEPGFLEQLAELAPDCCPVVAYGALIPSSILAVPKHGWVNLHFSLLPSWRGAAPVQHAVLAGDTVTGASTFRLEEGLDTGPVFGAVTTEIAPTDTSGALLERLSELGAGLLLATLDGIAAGTLEARPQPVEGVSLAPKLTPADARVDWDTPALRVDRLVRACTPAPGAWTTFRGKRLRLGPLAKALDQAPALAPGELADLGSQGVLVGTSSTPVRLGAVRPEGKGEMAADAWARGVRLQPGDRFDQPSS